MDPMSVSISHPSSEEVLASVQSPPPVRPAIRDERGPGFVQVLPVGSISVSHPSSEVAPVSV